VSHVSAAVNYDPNVALSVLGARDFPNARAASVPFPKENTSLRIAAKKLAQALGRQFLFGGSHWQFIHFSKPARLIAAFNAMRSLVFYCRQERSSVSATDGGDSRHYD
jgi:hypothetical protein